MSEHYDFHYQPTGSGAISGQQVLEQTEDAINELGDYVNDNVGGAMDVAQQALETAQNAEQDAQTALDTANSFSSAIQSAQQDASTALSTAQTAQTTASNANNTAIQAQQDASSAVTTANNTSGQVSTLSGTVTTLGQRVTTAEGNIGQNTSDITVLTTRVGTAEGNITTLQNDVTIAQGNASSAMATAGQVKQQAFVFRYSSTALVASSTNSNALLDNTDNLKVGDKVIDSSGVLFSITAIDTQNSTFTIGTALIDLANDSDVMHLSGDESALGIKAFIGTRTEFKRSNGDGVILFGNGSFTKGSAPNDTINICRKYYGDATSIGSVLGYSSVTVSNNGNKTTYQFYCIDNTAGSTSRTTIQMNYDKSLSGTNAQYINISGSLLPSTDNSYSLGNSTNKWSTINGLNPSSLGMPDLSNGIDISSYISYGTDRYDSTYTVPDNGYITIYGTCGGTASGMIITNGHYAQSSYAVRRSDLVFYAGVTLPVSAGDVVTISTNNVTSLINAKFYPCQGNV